MKITTADLTQDRQWRAMIGMSEQQFYTLSAAFTKAYFNTYGNTLSQRKVEVNIMYCLQNEEDLLLFTLMSLKLGLTYDALGVACGMSASNALRNQKIGLAVLATTLDNLNVMPKRNLLTIEDFKALFGEHQDLFIDATEQRIQRPQDKEFQKETYSGKKKANTLKAMIITTFLKTIPYISYCCEGKRHDFSLLKNEFKSDKPWFNDFNIHLDLAYIGFLDKYQCKNLFIPHKKPKNKPLTENQKEENKQLSSKRVIVEHSFAGLKRFRVLSDRLRLHRIDFYDDILGVCAGLWNFYLAN
jgi:hypothetical protein